MYILVLVTSSLQFVITRVQNVHTEKEVHKSSTKG